jgi:hypothetical protein
MDDDDYSWVRRTRFSHSAVRSNSGREQFGAFVEQFNRGAALRQKGAASGFKLHGLNMESGTRHSTSSNPGTSSLKGSSSDAKLRQHEKAGDRPLLQLQERSAKQGSGKDANGRKACGNLSVAVHREPAESPENETPGALEFSFHPDDQSMSLHRACSSPAPFPGKKTPGDEAMVRSSSLTALNQGPRLEQRARSPLPSRDVPEAFKEQKVLHSAAAPEIVVSWTAGRDPARGISTREGAGQAETEEAMRCCWKGEGRCAGSARQMVG